MELHLYVLCYRFEALVASNLGPEEFGRYMAVGTRKHTSGQVIFFEVRRDLPGDYFHLDDIEERCRPAPDGTPKRSKYVSIYRVMEHLPLDVFQRLYLTTADGRVLALDAGAGGPEEPGASLYLELCPVAPLIASSLTPSAFGRFMTAADNPIRVPRLFFADLLVDRDETGNLAGYLPYADPLHILDCLLELEEGAGKPTKTVSRTPDVHAFYRTIRRGFFLADATGMKFYPFPSQRALEVEHARWWRSAQFG